jgi:single-stranded-DNA-specific exonuclease
VLAELALAGFERTGPAITPAAHAGRTALERSAAFLAYQRQLEDGRRFLTSSDSRRLAA